MYDSFENELNLMFYDSCQDWLEHLDNLYCSCCSLYVTCKNEDCAKQLKDKIRLVQELRIDVLDECLDIYRENFLELWRN